MFPKVITGENLQLRVLEPTDENAAMLMNALIKSEKHRSTYLKQFWDYKNKNSVKRQLASRQQGMLEDKSVYYGIFEKTSDELVGEIAFIKQNDYYSHTAWIDENYTGRGYMQEAIILSEEAFFTSGHDKILEYARPSNKISLHVLNKHGYTQVGKDANYLVFQKKRSDYLKKR